MTKHESPALKTTLSSNLGATLKLCRTALYKHYTAPLAAQFKSLRTGFIVFAVGLATVLISNSSLTPSLEQELAVGLGLIVGGIGFVLAMMAYIRIVISRIIIFISKN